MQYNSTNEHSKGQSAGLEGFFSGGSGGLCITLSRDKYGKDAVTAFYLTPGRRARIHAAIYAGVGQSAGWALVYGTKITETAIPSADTTSQLRAS